MERVLPFLVTSLPPLEERIDALRRSA